jgi:hypothetical protein
LTLRVGSFVQAVGAGLSSTLTASVFGVPPSELVDRIVPLHDLWAPGEVEIVFHSSPASIRSYQKDVPFLMVGDPKKVLYKEFGVETSFGFMSLKALGAAMRGMAHGHLACGFLVAHWVSRPTS